MRPCLFPLKYFSTFSLQKYLHSFLLSDNFPQSLSKTIFFFFVLAYLSFNLANEEATFLLYKLMLMFETVNQHILANLWVYFGNF